MKSAYGLELLETQKLALTPEVRQAIMVLQMSALELSSFIRQQVEENPLLEIASDPQEESLPESLDPRDEELLACFCDSSDLGPSISGRTRENRAPLYETLAEDRPGLWEYLSAQLGLLDLSQEEHLAGELLIGNIDDNGYLRSSVEEISRVANFPIEIVERVLAVVQSLDPPGVGARDLRECLLLQARAARCGDVVLKIIDRHLDDLAAGRYRKIAKAVGVSVKEVMEARDVLLTLDPKPGARYSSESVRYVCPEITVRRTEDGVAVTVLDSALPRVRWNPVYKRLLDAGDKDARAYLQEQLQKARSLLKSIEQRRDTILRVMECVVSRQAAFFSEGPGRLEPLTMKDVAQELGLHESTVSRCLRDKYVDTPFGVFPCRSFFSSRVRADDRDVSQYQVKRLIQAMIQSEDPGSPLADQEIAEELSKRGVRVARRTIAKYRSQLGIKPSGRRKVL